MFYLKLKKGLFVVLIDSIEHYQIDNDIQKAVITALIQSMYEHYNNLHNNRIFAKAAFPSELYDDFIIINKGKIEGHNLFILWKYKDLVCLMAKRYLYWQNERNFSDDIEFNALNSYSTARNYLKQFIPLKLNTRYSIYFDTFAYILRHTLKKPRQVIRLFNIIYSYARKNKINLEYLKEDIVLKGIHARLDMLVSAELNLFEINNHKHSELIRSILSNKPHYFSSSKLDKFISDNSSIRNEAGISVSETKRLLLKSSSIGTQLERNKIGNDVDILESVFEYQIKATLFIDNDSICVVHPMFYQDFHSKINKSTFVYPTPFEDEEKEILSTKDGILLV